MSPPATSTASDTLSVGSHANCDIRCKHPSVSALHLTVSDVTPASLVVEDEGSTNGTRVNGELVRRRRVRASDALKLGSFELPAEKLLAEALKHVGHVDFSAAFASLEPDFRDYERRVAAIKTRSQLTKLGGPLLTLLVVVALSGPLTDGLGLSSPYPLIIGSTVVTALFAAARTYFGRGGDDQARIKRLQADFNHLRCPNPKCRAPLHAQPYDNYVHAGRCPRDSCAAKLA